MGILGIRQCYFGTTSGNTYVVQDGTYSDDGIDIPVRVKTKNYYLTPTNQMVKIEKIYVFSEEPLGSTVSISLDGGEYQSLGSIQEEIQCFEIWDKCYYFSLALDEISSKNFKIKGFNVEYELLPETL